MLVGGQSKADSTAANTEVMSLDPNECKCDAVTNFPATKDQVVGGLGLKETPFVCSVGNVKTSKCVSQIFYVGLGP